ncbi:MAG TPA: Crp/Fnr family transcriptional regulator [Polaromonas sp.]|uniref:Crp/Fnr family transcriptional regulator n=1 Tax=Polaromonas sp. UBA4122 TaxID=1947074 RepID=UPI000EC69D24|nr:Crp/Fnr family transcriptional regulator [Polaromonas sp. UBA4122]HAL39881.1 Crp/Fnr family transcriptional regulator [Polaromonas sp.]
MNSKFTQIHKELTELLPAGLRTFCTTSVHERGERLFATGDKPAHMFFIGTGEVVLERAGAQGGSVVLQRTRHGFVGEASLQSARYHCDAKVIAPSDITQVPIREFRAAMDSDPAFAIRWIGMLSKEVKRLRLQCERLSLNKVQDRLIHLLETEGQQGKFPIGTGLKSLAGELGVTHEALYRCVSDLEKKGALKRDEKNIILLSEPPEVPHAPKQ